MSKVEILINILAGQVWTCIRRQKRNSLQYEKKLSVLSTKFSLSLNLTKNEEFVLEKNKQNINII